MKVKIGYDECFPEYDIDTEDLCIRTIDEKIIELEKYEVNWIKRVCEEFEIVQSFLQQTHEEGQDENISSEKPSTEGHS